MVQLELGTTSTFETCVSLARLAAPLPISVVRFVLPP